MRIAKARDLDSTDLGNTVESHLNDAFFRAMMLLHVQDNKLYVDEVTDDPTEGVVLSVRFIVSCKEVGVGHELGAMKHIRDYVNTQDVAKDYFYTKTTGRGVLPHNVRMRVNSYTSDLEVKVINGSPDEQMMPTLLAEAHYKLGLTITY